MDYPEPRAICADCGQYLWMAASGWIDDKGHPTCWYRIDIGHVAVPINSDIDLPTYPASIAITPR